MIDFALAEAINTRINESTCYKSDFERVDRMEFWDVAVGTGDCEDYALAKRAKLLEQGASTDDLRLAVCQTETGGWHAVLIVTTDRGDYVLDNRYPEPMPRHMLDYRWDRIQKGKQWCKIL